MEKSIMYVCLDVHKTPLMSHWRGGRKEEVRHYGMICGDMAAVDKLVGNWCPWAVSFDL